MDFSNIDSIAKNGFSGFVAVSDLWADSSQIPKDRGVYLILNPDFENCEFMLPGVGGFFKGKDPNVSIQELESNHVLGSIVVYIGKAGSLTGKATLQSRLRQYLKFGQGKNIGHWGGRYIWQIKNHQNLVFCWKPTPDQDPRESEKSMIMEFSAKHGQRPFANLTS